ncbi:MAG TPA: DUF433 domain-containing protein, partial [Actinomycetota bacterium]|nr:DUF433 domain-containing protein [Actinomycetota bacterium]
MDRAVLDRQMYAVREAARLLGIPAARLRRWLNGAVVQGRPYPPVIRIKPTGSEDVTWAEFVEAGFLREYRGRRVPLQRLRPFIDALRDDFQVEYPLAHFKPAVDEASRELVLRAQEKVNLEDQLALIRRHGRRGGAWQLQWAAPVQKFLEKVEFDPYGVAERMRPLGGTVPVVIDPEVQFGIPQVGGVRTEAITEAFAEVGDAGKVAKLWKLDVREVLAALR